MIKLKYLNNKYPKYFQSRVTFFSEDFDQEYEKDLFFMIEEGNYKLEWLANLWYQDDLISFVEKPSVAQMVNSLKAGPAGFTGMASVIHRDDPEHSFNKAKRAAIEKSKNDKETNKT